jgi:hypothetical protein
MIKNPTNLTRCANPPKPNLVKVIRQRKLNEPSKSWWDIESNNYYSSLLYDKQYIYSFLTHNAAQNCLNFLEEYKKKNKFYPDLNPYSKLNKIDTTNIGIYIHEEPIHGLKHRCLTNGVGLIGISEFEYNFVETFVGSKNIFNLHLSAVDLLENEECEIIEHIDNLNYLLDF